MKKMKYNAPVVSIAAAATFTMLCSSAGPSAPSNSITFSPTPATGTTHAD